MTYLDSYVKYRCEDGSVWAVPVSVVVENRSTYYSNLDGIRPEEALEDTEVLFQDCDDSIVDWIENNMNWDDISGSAFQAYAPETRDAESLFLGAEEFTVADEEEVAKLRELDINT